MVLRRIEVDIDLLVSTAEVLPVGSYLYVQQPCLEVHNKQVAGYKLLQRYPK